MNYNLRSHPVANIEEIVEFADRLDNVSRRADEMTSEAHRLSMNQGLNNNSPVPSLRGTQFAYSTPLRAHSFSVNDRQPTNQLDYYFQRLDTKITKLEGKIDEQIEGLKKHVDDALAKQFKQLQDYIDKEVGVLCNRLNATEERIQQLENEHKKANEFDPEVTIVAENLQYEETEDLMGKITRLLRRELNMNVPVVQVQRLKPPPVRITNSGRLVKPGIVKIQFESVDHKVRVLREKHNLMNSAEFSWVRLRSSKSHAERMMEFNTRTLLEMIPDGKNFRLTANGRLVRNEPNVHGAIGGAAITDGNGLNWQNTDGSGFMRGRGGTSRGGASRGWSSRGASHGGASRGGANNDGANRGGANSGGTSCGGANSDGASHGGANSDGASRGGASYGTSRGGASHDAGYGASRGASHGASQGGDRGSQQHIDRNAPSGTQ